MMVEKHEVGSDLWDFFFFHKDVILLTMVIMYFALNYIDHDWGQKEVGVI